MAGANSNAATQVTHQNVEGTRSLIRVHMMFSSAPQKTTLIVLNTRAARSTRAICETAAMTTA